MWIMLIYKDTVDYIKHSSVYINPFNSGFSEQYSLLSGLERISCSKMTQPALARSKSRTNNPMWKNKVDRTRQNWRRGHLLSSVDDILGQSEAIDTGPPGDRVVTRWGVSHLHGIELQEGLSQSHSAEQQVPAGGHRAVCVCVCRV